MKLYHGSNQEIAQIDLKKGRRGKDFGQGFYLSEDYGQALKMAGTATDREEEGTPTVTTYEFDESLLQGKDLNVKIFREYSLEWVDFILMNRSNRTATPRHNYDLVYGPIADDDVGLQLTQYYRGYQKKEDLVEGLKFRLASGEIKITFQYFFGTEKAISKLCKCDE